MNGRITNVNGEFPGSSMVRTPCFHCRGLGSILGWRTKIPQVAQHDQEKQNETKDPKCPSANEPKDMVCIFNGVLLNHKKEKKEK